MLCLSDDNQKSNAVSTHCIELIRLISDPTIMCDGDPTAFANGSKPSVVGAIGFKVVPMSLYGQTGGGKDGGEPVAKIAIREEDKTQAARS
jgi:hypothetical protein